MSKVHGNLNQILIRYIQSRRRCDAFPTDLDCAGSHRRSHEKTDLLIKSFEPEILWDEFGIRNDIMVHFAFVLFLTLFSYHYTVIHQPFTHGFPRADIHELLAPDLLHQIIKGTFKDHFVTWVIEYLHLHHGEAVALDVIENIDHR